MRPVEPQDFRRIRVISDPQVSPDGQRCAFVLKDVESDGSRYRSHIWTVDLPDGFQNERVPVQFTAGPCSDSSPRWSPDGRQLAFLSDRRKPHNQLFLISAGGGEARELTHLKMECSIRGPRWSPDGFRIALLVRETPAAYTTEQVEARKREELPAPPRVHKKLGYRADGVGFHDDCYWQIWITVVETGEARPLTDGPYDCGIPCFSPDGQQIYFLSDRREDEDIAGVSDDIYCISVDGGKYGRINAPEGPKQALAPSPDGQWLAYAGGQDPLDQWGTDNTRLYLLPAAGSETARDLTAGCDLSVGYLTLSDVQESGRGDLIRWSEDSSTLYFTVSSRGDTQLFRSPKTGGGEFGSLESLTPPGGEVGGFSVSQDRTLITRGTSTEPHELFVATDGSAWRAVTSFHTAWLSEVELAMPQPLPPVDPPLYGWTLRSARSGHERLPLVVYVHGGPHLQYGNVLFHELQLLAAKGYQVLYLNPRGSKGYGEEHTRAIRGKWGGPDFEDVERAVDLVLETELVDPSRTAIMGGSYGGYMTAWAIGHTDRYRCAIADRLVANLVSMSGTCDFPWRENHSFGGSAWNRSELLWMQSPLAYASRITTPLLLIHSDGDLRCDVGQAEELFAALRLQGKPVEFVRYPAETSHDLSRGGPPPLRLDRLQRNLEWLDRWMKNGAVPDEQ